MALLLLNRGNRVLFGEEIKDFIKPREKSVESMIMGGEPLAFSFSNENEIVSDKFSFLDMSADDLLAKGGGGMRMLYNYATLDSETSIETPPRDTITLLCVDLNIIYILFLFYLKKYES